MVTVRDQLTILTGVSDQLQEIASTLANHLKNYSAPAIEEAKEALLDELSIVRSLVSDVQHQEDLRETQQQFIRRCNDQHARSQSNGVTPSLILDLGLGPLI